MLLVNPEEMEALKEEQDAEELDGVPRSKHVQ